MALFTLTDIKIRDQKNRISLSKNTFNSDTYKFPLDIGEIDKGHYVVFNIYVSQFIQQNYKCTPSVKGLTQNQSGATIGDITGAARDLTVSAANFATGLLNEKTANFVRNIGSSVSGVIKDGLNAVESTEIGKQGVEISTQFFNQIKRYETGNLSSARVANKVTQIADTIVLYMPNTMNYSQQQFYREISRNDYLTNAAVGIDMLKEGNFNVENIIPYLAGTFNRQIGEFANSIGSSGTVSAILARNFGIENPRAELLYTRPSFRTFNFEFVLYPRSEKEAHEVQKIITKFNHHSVPSLKDGSAGQYLVPPAEFGISFFYNGIENPNIPKIKQCVLESINADYAPNGFHAYESSSGLGPSLGGTGMPIAIRLTMNFRELELLTKSDYPDKNYGNKDENYD